MKKKDQEAIAKLYAEGYNSNGELESSEFDVKEPSSVITQRKFIARLMDEIHELVKSGIKDDDQLEMLKYSLETARNDLQKIRKWERGEGEWFQN